MGNMQSCSRKGTFLGWSLTCVTQLHTIFTFTNFTISIPPSRLPDIFTWHTANYATCFCLITGEIKNEQLRMLIDKYYVGAAKEKRKSIELLCGLENSMFDLPPLDRLVSRKSTWLTGEIFLGIDAFRIDLREARHLNSSHLNSFIKNWKEKEAFFEYLVVENEFDLPEILNGIEVEEEEDVGGSDRPNRMTINNRSINCDNGVNIRRKDGKIAMVVVNDNLFAFIVCNS